MTVARVGNLPFSVLSACARNKEALSRIPYFVVPGTIFAAVARESRRARLTLRSCSDQNRASWVFCGLPSMPPAEKSPFERTLPRAVELSSLELLDLARIRPATFVQPGGRAAAWGVNSFAESPIRAGPTDRATGGSKGTLMPVLLVVGSASVSGLWLAGADRDVAPGASHMGVHPMVINGEPQLAPRVTKNCAKLLDMFERKLDGGEGVKR